MSNNTTRTKPVWRAIPGRLLPAATLNAAVSLPGFRELATIANSLVDIVKGSTTERDRCVAIEFRIRSTTRLVQDMPLLRQKDIDEFERTMVPHAEPDVHYTSDFQAIRTLFDDTSPLGHKPYQGADVQLEILEELDRRLEVVDNLVKMRLQLGDYIASNNSRLNEVDAHSIVDQQLIPLRSLRWPDQMAESLEVQPLVRISHRSGRIGNMPISYVTYSCAQAPGEAEARVREELQWMSRFIHPNVATIVGVTRGPWLNGIVYSSCT
ncbi:hypothetical protein FRC12_005216 [Ceratobasidium sp. 428]|nr:hypothetical protein FRC12_005216 [Ceratobasidium sp. 428]